MWHDALSLRGSLDKDGPLQVARGVQRSTGFFRKKWCLVGTNAINSSLGYWLSFSYPPSGKLGSIGRGLLSHLPFTTLITWSLPNGALLYQSFSLLVQKHDMLELAIWMRHFQVQLDLQPEISWQIAPLMSIKDYLHIQNLVAARQLYSALQHLLSIDLSTINIHKPQSTQL